MKYTTDTAKYTWQHIVLGFSEANRKRAKLKEKSVSKSTVTSRWWPVSTRKIGCMSPPESEVLWKT